MGYSSFKANLGGSWMTGYPVVRYTDYFVKKSASLYVCGAIVLYIFALSSNRYKERSYHIIGYLERPIIIAFWLHDQVQIRWVMHLTLRQLCDWLGRIIPGEPLQLEDR